MSCSQLLGCSPQPPKHEKHRFPMFSWKRLVLLTQDLKNKVIRPIHTQSPILQQKERESAKFSPATELLWKRFLIHALSSILSPLSAKTLYSWDSNRDIPASFPCLRVEERNCFPRGQCLLPPPWLTPLCPPAAEKAEAIQTRAQPLEREAEGSFEEEQTTNKLHGHYPLCILVLIGVADSCLLIRKGSRKTHKFSQGSQTARSHVRQLRTLPWAQKQNRA